MLKFFVVFLIIFLTFASSYGQESVLIESDSIERDKDDIITAKGNVVVTYLDKVLKSDIVIYDAKNKKVTLPEKFYIKTKSFEGTGSRGWVDVENDEGEIFDYEGVVEGKYFVRGKYLKRVKDTYYFNDGEFSSCPFDQYDWNIKASSGSLKQNDKVKTYNMTFRFCRIPIFYTPYFSYPATNRKTGLLQPLIGQDTYNTFIYKQPVFFVINDSSDITLTTDYRNKQGFGLSTEYRRLFDKGVYLNVQLDMFKEKSNGFWWQNRDTTPITNRWRFKLESNYSPFDRWQFFTKVDIPSDRYFFEDFYNFSFLKYTAFTSSYIVGRTQTKDYLIEANINYFYDLTTPNNKQTLQRLPEVRFYWKEKQLLNLPIYYDFLSESTYFYRQEGTSGFRFDNTLRLSNYAYFDRFLNHFEISPKFTLYLNTKDSNTLDTRFLIPIKDTLRTTFIKSYSSFNHLIIPQVSFEYISKVNQSNLPIYDRNDRINEKEDVDFTLYNILNFKNDYFLRWELSQGYSLLDHYYIGDVRYNSSTKSLKNSIFMSIKGFSVDSILYYDWQKKQISRTVSSVSIPINKYINYSVSYIEDNGDTSQSKQMSNSISINYLNYSFSGYILTNLKDNYTQRKMFTFNWNRGCWSLSFGYLDDYNITTQRHYRNVYIVINILDVHYRLPFVRN